MRNFAKKISAPVKGIAQSVIIKSKNSHEIVIENSYTFENHGGISRHKKFWTKNTPSRLS